MKIILIIGGSLLGLGVAAIALLGKFVSDMAGDGPKKHAASGPSTKEEFRGPTKLL